jgi:hypothetical protein
MLTDYTVVLRPDKDAEDWWAGAPSVTYHPDDGFYLATRMRSPEMPKGQRGYEIRILHSEDGRNFTRVHAITREDAKCSGFERPALLRDPATGKYRLYACTELGPREWVITRFDDVEKPTDFDGSTMRTVLKEEYPDDDTIHVTGHKDAVIHREGDTWHLYTIGIDLVERVHHFTSPDGDTWTAADHNPVMENIGWHIFYTRPSCVVPLDVGYLLVYAGSHVTWHDPNYNIGSGLAYTLDLNTFVDLTPDEPLFISPTPGVHQTWRYSEWVPVGDQLYVYAEVACPNGSNEIRLSVLDGVPRVG